MCAAGEFNSSSSANNQHVQKSTESWSKMALAIGGFDVHAKLCVCNVRSNEIFYHINITFHNFITDTVHCKLRRMVVKRFFCKHMHGDKFQTTYINHMNSSLLNVLEKVYAALMDAYNPSYTPHSTWFLKLLKENVPGLNDSKLHGVNFVSIREKTGKDAEELLNSHTLSMMARISKALQIKLKNMKNEFNGSFMTESPLPCELLILFYLIMNGSNHEGPASFMTTMQ